MGIVDYSFFDSVRDFAFDWPIGTIMFIVMSICLVILLLLGGDIIISLIYYVLDYAYVPTRKGTGRVVEKKFTPAHTETNLRVGLTTSAAAAVIPVNEYCPECWALVIDVDGRQTDFNVNKETFDGVPENAVLDIEYYQGRISRDISIETLRYSC